MLRHLPAAAAVCLVLGLAFAGGCGGPPPPGQMNQRMTADDRARLNAPRDEFEQGKEVPIGADTHFAAGQFAESQGKMAQALEQYRKALTLNPNHRSTLFRLGVVYIKQKKLNEAIETWRKYVEVTQGDATAYANLGFACELAGRSSEAEAAYLKGIKREPTNAPCRVNYGLMLARKERFNEATLQLQTVLSEAEVHYNLASVYEQLGRREKAKIEYRKALSADPELKEAQARLEAMQ
jgi:tetratricopeptide (TPR) repeat protein